MNKSVIALAVAAALAASVTAQADTTLYGSARVSVDWNNPGAKGQDDYWEVVNDLSRLGVKGSEDLGGGLSAIYQYEFGVDVPGGNNYFESNRPRWVGLKGNFGSVTLGTQFTPYYNIVGYSDQFNSGKTPSYWLGSRPLLPTSLTGKRGIMASRKGNSLVYTTPDFSGFTAQAMLEADGKARQNDVDTWELNAKWQQKGGGLIAGAAYIREEVTDDQQYSLLIAYDTKMFGVGFTWEHYDPDNSKVGNGEGDAYTIVGSYNFGPNVIRALYSKNEMDNRKDIDTYQVGYQYNLSKRTRLWAEYIREDDQEKGDVATIDVVSLGIRHDF